MEMQQLRHFHAVAEHGNLLRAARTLHITQPGLSRSIKALETQLDVRLFDRTPRGVTLTPFGTELLSHVRVILNEQQRAILSVNALRNGRRGHINVGVGQSFASSLLPQAVKILFESDPNISMRVREGYYEELVRLLRVGEVDLVLSLMPPPGDRVDDLVIKPLVEMRSEVVASGRHPLAGKRNVTMNDLGKAKWLVQDQAHATRSFLDLFARSDVPPPAVVIKTTSMSFLRGMLLTSDFVALIGDQLLAPEIANGRLAILNGQLPMQIRQAGAIYRAFGTTHPAINALLQGLTAVCKASTTGPVAKQ